MVDPTFEIKAGRPGGVSVVDRFRLGALLGRRSSSWALIDQGVASLGSFATNITIARVAAPGLYGAFALLLGLILFLNSVQAALVIYPFSLRTATAKERSVPSLLAAALFLTGVLFVPGALALLGACLYLHSLRAYPAVLLLLLAWQFQEIFRRGLMAQRRYWSAIPGDLISYPAQALGIWGLSRIVPLSLSNIFVCMALASFTAGACQCFQLRITPSSAGLHSYLRDFWRLGKWGFAGGCLALSSNQGYAWTLAIFFGTAQAASLQVLTNVIGVVHPVMIGIGNLMVPSVAVANAQHGERGAWRKAARYGLWGAALVTPYFSLLTLFPVKVLSLFYGGSSPYLGLALPLQLLVLSYGFGYAAQVAAGLLNGLQRPRGTFWSQAGASATAFVIGLPLTALGGIVGATGSAAFSNAARLIVGFAFLRSPRRAQIAL